MTPTEQFYKYTRYDIKKFFASYGDFVDKYYNDVVQYYSGNLSLHNSLAFDALKKLLSEVNIINHHISIHQNAFVGLAMWDLIEAIDDVATKLKTIENTPKWIRSSITKNSFATTTQTTVVTRQQQTLEQLTRSLNQVTDFDNEWTDIAVANDISEVDYSSRSNVSVTVNQSTRSFTFNIQSVVAVMNDDAVYGRDIQKHIEFNGDDLKVLDGSATIQQAVDILINLRRGDNFQYPENGIAASLVVGSTSGSIVLPIIIRQLNKTFANDDTLSQFTLTDITNDKDVQSYQFSVKTRLGEFITATL